MIRPIIITGGAGFIGSALVKEAIAQDRPVVVVDCLTYAGRLESLEEMESSTAFHFEKATICDRERLKRIFDKYQPQGVIHLAAESHVDRSIDGPDDFIKTNIDGTYQLLEVSRSFLKQLPPQQRASFRFHHVSTDEVYGCLSNDSELFTEETPYDPSSPYSASKAASDHLVRAWGRTFQLPALISNCSNNYGPRQFPEKLIPHTILNALSGQPIPIYGDGSQVRDWLYVEDHAKAMLEVYSNGLPGETYNIGGNNEMENIDVVSLICDLLEELAPCRKTDSVSHFKELITFVKDRPGHDIRYAIDSSKIKRELGWAPKEDFKTGLKKTVEWYLANQNWWQPILDGSYRLERQG